MKLEVHTLNLKMHSGFFLLLCAWGFFFEWFFGFFWSVIGSSPWIYPNSPLTYTSWKVAPLWGLGVLTVLQLHKIIKERDKRDLYWVAVLQALSMLWIAILSGITL